MHFPGVSGAIARSSYCKLTDSITKAFALSLNNYAASGILLSGLPVLALLQKQLPRQVLKGKIGDSPIDRTAALRCDKQRPTL